MTYCATCGQATGHWQGCPGGERVPVPENPRRIERPEPLSEPREWVVRCEGKLWTHNAERRLHWSERAGLVRQWRNDFGWLVRQARIPRLERISVEARQECRTALLPDPAACAPVVKAAVDALVDVGVVDDDDGSHVVWIRFWPAVKTGRAALVVHVVEQPEETGNRSIAT